jgi:hypothetical protein
VEDMLASASRRKTSTKWIWIDYVDRIERVDDGGISDLF